MRHQEIVTQVSKKKKKKRKASKPKKQKTFMQKCKINLSKLFCCTCYKAKRKKKSSKKYKLDNQQNSRKYKIKSSLPKCVHQEYLLPPKSYRNIGKKTLILDLDETLVHSSFDVVKHDIQIRFKYRDQEYPVYVCVRPGLSKFLKKVSKLYELIIFTASLEDYASPLLDRIDPDHLISQRLYRNHCTFYNSLYIKDLRMLGRPLKDVMLLDNSPIAYQFQPQNGIPIKDFFFDDSDNCLAAIYPFLKDQSTQDDVRPTQLYYREFYQDKTQIDWELSSSESSLLAPQSNLSISFENPIQRNKKKTLNLQNLTQYNPPSTPSHGSGSQTEKMYQSMENFDLDQNTFIYDQRAQNEMDNIDIIIRNYKALQEFRLDSDAGIRKTKDEDSDLDISEQSGTYGER